MTQEPFSDDQTLYLVPGQRTVHVFCEHLSPADESACNPKPKSLRQAGSNPLMKGTTIWRATRRRAHRCRDATSFSTRGPPPHETTLLSRSDTSCSVRPLCLYPAMTSENSVSGLDRATVRYRGNPLRTRVGRAMSGILRKLEMRAH